MTLFAVFWRVSYQVVVANSILVPGFVENWCNWAAVHLLKQSVFSYLVENSIKTDRTLWITNNVKMRHWQRPCEILSPGTVDKSDTTQIPPKLLSILVFTPLNMTLASTGSPSGGVIKTALDTHRSRVLWHDLRRPMPRNIFPLCKIHCKKG